MLAVGWGPQFCSIWACPCNLSVARFCFLAALLLVAEEKHPKSDIERERWKLWSQGPSLSKKKV